MKKLSKTAAIALFALIPLLGCISCSRNAEKKEVALLSALIFSETLADVTIFIEIDSLKANGQWTNICVFAGVDVEAPSNLWPEQESVTICNAKQMRDVYETLLSKYGKGDFQLKIVTNDAGCKKIYHRDSAFGDI
jgi:hypothetical protein